MIVSFSIDWHILINIGELGVNLGAKSAYKILFKLNTTVN